MTVDNGSSIQIEHFFHCEIASSKTLIVQVEVSEEEDRSHVLNMSLVDTAYPFKVHHEV